MIPISTGAKCAGAANPCAGISTVPDPKLQPFLTPIAQSPIVAELCRRLADTRHVAATGQWGSCALVLAAVAQQKLNRPILIITAHLDEADDAIDQLLFLHPGC